MHAPGYEFPDPESLHLIEEIVFENHYRVNYSNLVVKCATKYKYYETILKKGIWPSQGAIGLIKHIYTYGKFIFQSEN